MLLLLLQRAAVWQIHVDVPSLGTKVPLSAVAGLGISEHDHVVAYAAVQEGVHEDSGEQFHGAGGGWLCIDEGYEI